MHDDDNEEDVGSGEEEEGNILPTDHVITTREKNKTLCESSVSSRSALYEKEARSLGSMGGQYEDVTAAVAMVQSLFHMKKFILREDELAYNGLIAKGFCSKMGVPENFRKGWWEGVRQKVRKTLDKKRNAASQAIKDAFMTLRMKKQLPTLSDILELRGNEETMDIFCDTIISCVVGKVEWKKNRCVKPMGQVATVSDEAFALLVLENIWEIWSEVPTEEWLETREETKKKSVGVAAEENSDENQKTPPPREKTKKVRAGKYTGNYIGAGKFRGWNAEGIQRYNELLQLVRKNREDYPDYDDGYLERMQDKHNSKKTKKYAGEKEFEGITVDEDLSGWL